MAPYVFICKESGGAWKAAGYSEKKDLSAEAGSIEELATKLKEVLLLLSNSTAHTRQLVKSDSGFTGPLSISHSRVSPKSTLFVCNLGAPSCGGGAPAGGAPAAGAAPAAAAAPEEEEEEEDEDMDFDLFGS